MMKKTTIAYLAGIIDGEGSIGIGKTKHKTSRHKYEYYDLRLRIAMTTEEPIQTLQSLFGGKLSISQRAGIRRDIRELFWSGDKAMNILKLLKPYLLLKCAQAQLAIEFREYCNKYHRFGHRGTPMEVMTKRRDYYQQMKILNKRGVDAE